MLDIRLIRSDPALVRRAIERRGSDPAPLDALLKADERRRALLGDVEALRAERNRVTEEIAKIKRTGADVPRPKGRDGGPQGLAMAVAPSDLATAMGKPFPRAVA